MLHHIEVTNFRGLQKFRMEQLGRVNLLVGSNNCGKTSVLEAISILMEQGSASPFWDALSRRGEVHFNTERESEYEVEHLFYGRQMVPDAAFTIEGINRDSGHHVEARVSETDQPNEQDHDPNLGPLDLWVTWTREDAQPHQVGFPLTKGGCLSRSHQPRSSAKAGPEVVFLTTETLSRYEVVSFLEDAMLTPEEDTVLDALRTIEPGIERIAPVGGNRGVIQHSRRGGVAVKLAGQRVPIGSLGDGIWRLLGIALSLVKARGGVLLVDEIDTGLHYSVLEKMWRLVHETAKRLDVQVFATTHSRDCYESLAAIAQPTGHDVTIQRIERGKPLAVTFSEAEIVQAAQRGIEVR